MDPSLNGHKSEVAVLEETQLSFFQENDRLVIHLENDEQVFIRVIDPNKGLAMILPETPFALDGRFKGIGVKLGSGPFTVGIGPSTVLHKNPYLDWGTFRLGDELVIEKREENGEGRILYTAHRITNLTS